MNSVTFIKQEALSLLETLVKNNPGLIKDEVSINEKELTNSLLLAIAFNKNLKMYLTKGIVK